MQLISELRRRQVFRTAAWYAAAAWCAVQVANTVVPELGLPEWSVRAVIVAAALGLPVALMLAWVFDPSVPGLRRESSAPASVDGAHGVATLWRIPSFWIALAKRRLGRFDEAIAHFREAARLMPAQPQHSLRVFETLEGLGRLAEAEQERKAFAQRFPDWRAPAELSGFHVRFLATGATDGWQEAYERLAPGLSPAIRSYFFGRLCLAAGDLAGYAAFVEAADRSEFESASNRVVELGRATAALGDRARARPYLQSVVDETRAPDGVPLTDGAVALALLGRPDEAVRAADEAIRLVPESRSSAPGC